MGRDSVEALPGFLGWLRFGEEAPDGTVREFWSHVGEIGVAFGEAGKSVAVFDLLETLRQLDGYDPDDASYMWDGSQEGWRLRGTRSHGVLLKLREPLGEMPARELRALRALLSQAGGLDHFSAFQSELLCRTGNSELATEFAARTRGAGFDCETRASVHYTPVRERGAQSVGVILENEEDSRRIVEHMLDAGVPVDWNDDG